MYQHYRNKMFKMWEEVNKEMITHTEHITSNEYKEFYQGCIDHMTSLGFTLEPLTVEQQQEKEHEFFIPTVGTLIFKIYDKGEN